MAFAQPLALFFLFLFVPVILLYLLKQRRRRVVVSTLLFWDQVLQDEQRVASITKLRKWLSLLLQLLLLLLMILALARPLLAGDFLGARRIVVLLDTSASMKVREGDTTRFEMARERARDVVEGMSVGDSAMLVTLSETADAVVPFTNSRKTLLDYLRRVEPVDAGTNIAEAAALLEQLPPDERKTEVYVISDGAADPATISVGTELKFAYLKVGAAADNVGISHFEARPSPAAPRDFEILFEVTNASDRDTTLPYELRVDGSLVDAGELEIAANGRATQNLRQFNPEGGAIELFVDHDDPFSLDNRAFAVLPPPAPIHVALVSAGDAFFESAFSTDDDVILESILPGMYDASLLAEDTDVVVFAGWAPESPPPYPSIFAGAWPSSLGEQGAELADPLITDWDREHPINRHLQLTNVSIGKAWKLPQSPTARVLITSFDDPLVTLEAGEGGPILLVGFDTTSSDLPLRVAFPIMMSNAIRMMSGRDAQEDWGAETLGSMWTRAELDDRLSRVHHHDHGHDDYIVVRPGDEPEDELAPDSILAVDRVGVYHARFASGEAVPLFAANLTNARESSIAPSETPPFTSTDPLPQIEAGFRLGLEPWYFLLIAAIVLIAVEWVLFHRRWAE